MTAAMDTYVHCTASLHGLSAGDVRLRNPEGRNVLVLSLDGHQDVSVYIHLEPVTASGGSRAGDLERDRQGLLALAKAASDAAGVLAELAGPAAGYPDGPAQDRPDSWYDHSPDPDDAPGGESGA